MGKRLLDYETHHNPVSYIKRDKELLFLDEMSYGNDSFRNLLIPHFEEKQTYTIMSKL
jgi:hypothetical protein